MNREEYLSLRNKYLPSVLKNIFLLESPPVSGRFFYCEKGSVKESLFKAMMDLLGVSPKTKKEGLLVFQKMGNFLVDATYTTVNKMTDKNRRNTILSDYENLIEDLRLLCGSSDIPIIIVKSNICRLLESKLSSDGFNVKNKGLVIPFPSHGQQNNFAREIRKIYCSGQNT
jgi:hypothetical protein